jgi:hypothetical protein
MKSLSKRYRVEVIVHEVVPVENDDPEFKLVTQAECDFNCNSLDLMSGDANWNRLGPMAVEQYLKVSLRKIENAIAGPVIEYAMKNTAL